MAPFPFTLYLHTSRQPDTACTVWPSTHTFHTSIPPPLLDTSTMAPARSPSQSSEATAPVTKPSRFNFSKGKTDLERGEKTAPAAGPGAGGVASDHIMRDPLSKQSTSDIATVDAVWGEISEDGPNYRALGW